MGNSVLQPSLTGGEIGPELYGRVDLARYLTSVKVLKNFFVRPYGGVSNRAGSKLVAEVKDSSAVTRIIPFQFNTEQTYILELGDQYMRVHADGGPILDGGSPVEVGTPWGTSDLSELKYTQSADVMTVCHPDYPPQSISRTSHVDWTVSDYVSEMGPWQPINVDQAVTVHASSTTGDAVTVTASSDLFTADHVGCLFYMEQSDFSNPWEVDVAVSAGNIRRSDGKYYAALNSADTGTVRPSHSSGTASDGKVRWAYLHPGFGSAVITEVHSPTEAVVRVTSRLPDDCCRASTSVKTITAISAYAGKIKATSTAHGLATGAILYVSITYVDTLAGTKTITGLYTITKIDANNFTFGAWPSDYASFTSGTASTTTAKTSQDTYKWAFGAWGGDQGYPSCSVYHQQRQVFAATPEAPQTLWFSKTADFHNFSTSSPVVDDDAITATIASTQVNAIQSMIPLDKLVLLSSGGEWIVSGGDSEVLTPSSLSCKLQGYRGASGIPPLGIGNTAVYVQANGRGVRDLGYEFASDSYTGNDLLTFAPHLTQRYGITDWAFSSHPDLIIWAVREDGVLLSCTYMREQQVAGWARHETDGLYESVACVSEGDEDAVYAVVKRGSKRFVERFQSRLVTDQREAFFVDCGLTYDGRNTGATTITLSGGTNYDNTETITITASSSIFVGTSDIGDQVVYWDAENSIAYRITITGYTSGTVVIGVPVAAIPEAYRSERTDWALARNTISGLDHLEGYTVAILGDGFVYAPQEVVAGAITIAPPAYLVHAGLPYESELRTLNVVVQGDNFLDRVKNIGTVRALVHESRGIKAGRNTSKLYAFKSRSSENYDAPPNLQSDLVEIDIACDWSKDGSVTILQTDPLPITILAIMPEVQAGGR